MKIVRITGLLWEELSSLTYLVGKLKELSYTLDNQEGLSELITEFENQMDNLVSHYKTQNSDVVATAGKLSRSPKSIEEILHSSRIGEKNQKLIGRIIGMGHESIIEHDYHVFSLENVSAIVEQTLIENRFASYTIQSRREVDFRNTEFYIPTFHDEEGNIHKENELLQEEYRAHAKKLFESYGTFIDHGAKKEEARYILPYSFYSKIIMGMNSRELKKVTVDCLTSPYTELQELGFTFKSMIEKEVPYLMDVLEKELEKRKKKDTFTSTHVLDRVARKVDYTILPRAHVVSMPENVDELILCSEIMGRYQCSYEHAKNILETITKEDETFPYVLMDSIKNNSRQRALEQVNFTIQMPFSLAILTHLTRHRVQSLEVPNFTPLWNMNAYHVPCYFEEEDRTLYQSLYQGTKELCESFRSRGVREEDLIYFYQAGQMCNVTTTLNGRSIAHITSLRTCNKAQEPNRIVWNEVIRQIEEKAPIFASILGPNCQVLGYCPEGKESCGNPYPLRQTQQKMQQKVKKYYHQVDTNNRSDI